ncbi:uncharacterized protein LOC117233472 [Bombus vosnesenskii]|uniref:Uncharacterized protein LOC117233472 n=1 Tax=Bombus vosnesenskii TaxID=207650 RepID=A0A6J3K9B6_9HYME|nr:uncharacterized protein LOC117233472 [Bombus vosnesenskii]
MCATITPCRSPPRSRSPTENPTDDVRFHQQHSPHPPPYIYYPPPYPHLNPYGPYPYHPGAFYSPPYCNEVSQESKGSSWFSIVLLVFLLLCVVSIIFYRSLSRDSRRRLNARLPTLVQPAQTADRKRDAKQNYPAEFVLYSDVTDPLDRDYNIICDGCEDRQRGNQPDCIWDRSRNESIIEYSSENKVNVATDISGTSMKEVSRSVATWNHES